MTAADTIFNLRARANRLKELEAVQTDTDARNLVLAEKFYVETLLDCWEKLGRLPAITLPYDENF